MSVWGTLRRMIGMKDRIAELPPSPLWEIRAALARLAAGDGAAAAAVGQRLGEVRGLGWIALDVSLRAWLGTGPETPHALDAPEGVRALEVPAADAAAVFAALASHPSGWVREAAVERLAALPGAGALAPLLVRAADVVEPVRRRAVEALRARLAPALTEAWVDSLVLLLRLRRSGRAEARALAADAEAFLATAPARAAVAAGLASPEREVRRACYRFLLAGAPDDVERVRAGLSHPDGAIRVEAARAAERLDDAAAAELAPHLLDDPLPAVRAAGVRLAARAGWMEDALLRAASDRSAAVRREAREALGGDDAWFADAYRRSLVRGRPAAGALLGLGETGGADDAPLAEACLIDLRPRVRRAAVVALVRLDPQRALPALVIALADPSPAVSRAAARRLEPRARDADPAALAALLAPDRPRHVRLGALSVLARRGKWDGIVAVLDALRDGDAAVRSRAGDLLRRWRRRFNRSSVAPSPAEAAAVRAAIDRAAGSLPAETVRWLRFVAR